MKKNNLPKYKEIENDILEKMNAQYYKTGEAIPTEQQLAESYGVSRVTIRKATDALVMRGLLKRITGSGTYVEGLPAHQKETRQIGFTKEMESLHMNARTEVTTFSTIQADSHIASFLGIQEDDLIYYIERNRYGDDLLLQFEISYMPVALFPDLSISHLRVSKYDYVENVRGIKIDYCHHQTFPILPPEALAKEFQIDCTTPIIKIINMTHDVSGRVIDYTIQYINSPHYQLNYIRKR